MTTTAEPGIVETAFDEALSDGICLVEWPQKGLGVLPAEGIALTFVHEGDGRRVTVDGPAAALARPLSARPCSA